MHTNKVECRLDTLQPFLQRFKMRNVSAPELTSYAGSATAIGSSMTLTKIGIIVGIVTALLTFILNIYYMRRKDQREQELAELQKQQILHPEHVQHE